MVSVPLSAMHCCSLEIFFSVILKQKLCFWKDFIDESYT